MSASAIGTKRQGVMEVGGRNVDALLLHRTAAWPAREDGFRNFRHGLLRSGLAFLTKQSRHTLTLFTTQPQFRQVNG